MYNKLLEEIRVIANESMNCSDILIEILQNQKCLYVLSKMKNCPSKVSSLIAMNRLIQNYRYTYCKDIFRELEAIPHAVIKGAVLSERVYGEPYYRSSGDIDLLVSPKYTEQVAQILQSNGFVQGKIENDSIEKYTRKATLYYKSYTHQLAPFVKKTDFQLSPFLNIDINFGILWGENDHTINMEEYLLHTEKRRVFDIEISVLRPIYEFIALCLHHYKDMNSVYLLSERGLCLNEFFDIYYYIINVRPNIDELSILAKKYGIKEYIYYCIYYTNEIFQHPYMVKYLEKLKTPQVLRLLDYYGLADSEKRKWENSFLERLFDQNFKALFFESLSEKDIQKIMINKRFI